MFIFDGIREQNGSCTSVECNRGPFEYDFLFWGWVGVALDETGCEGGLRCSIALQM